MQKEEEDGRKLINQSIAWNCPYILYASCECCATCSTVLLVFLPPFTLWTTPCCMNLPDTLIY